MAQQTINVGTSPNDGTGTPLRTAFQYTNSNFSELYTAVGPSGNNIVVPGNATITGDLTVDTSTLKVDSANNRVGIGTASPSYILDILGASPRLHIRDNGTGSSLLDIENGAGTFYVGRENSTGSGGLSGVPYAGILYLQGAYPLIFGTNFVERYRIDATGVATWSVAGSTAMTLNSTGLGIGIAPESAKSTRLSVYQTGDLTDETAPLSVGNTAAGGMRLYAGVNNTNEYVYIGSVKSGTGYRSMILQPNGGNVGIGGNASATGIDTGVARLFVVAPNSNTGMAATFIADSVGRGLLVADQGKTNSFGVEVVAGLVKTGGFTSGTSVALFANAVERARVKSTGQVRFVPLAADPSGAEAGDVYYNSSSNKLKCYNGSIWNDLF